VARNLLGTLALEDNDFALAESSFRQTTIVAPNSPEAHANLGLSLLHRGRAAEAADSLEQAVLLARGKVSVRTNLAVAYCALEQYGKAIPELEAVLDSAPDLPQANFHYGVTLMKTGETDRAIRCFHSVIASDPKMWHSHLYLARLYEQKQQRNQAVRYAHMAVKLSGGFPEATELLRQLESQ